MTRQRSWMWIASIAGALAGLGSAIAQPSNDNCSAARAASTGLNPFDLTGATNDFLATCDRVFDQTTHDVWFTFTPTSTGTAIVTTCGQFDQSFATTISVLTACNGAEIACNSDYCPDGQSTLSFPAAQGTHYLIRIASADLNAGVGAFRITLVPGSSCSSPPPGAPANDCCSRATPVGNGSFVFTTVGATLDQPDECNLLHDSPDVWFNYTASATGFARVRPGNDAPPDLTIVVRDGSCAAPVLACSTDLIRGVRQLVFPVVAGGHYLIRLASLGLDPSSGHVSIAFILPPANDECTTATSITGLGTFPFDNTIANNSGPDDAPACDGFGGSIIAHDVWFLWTSTLPPGQDAVVSTCGGTFVDTKIAVYPFPCPVGSPLACNDDDCFLQSTLAFTPTPGGRYLIRIGNWPGFNGDDGPDGEPGTFTIDSQPTCTLTPPPGAMIEPEPCGADTNGGCDSPSFAFTDVPCGTTTIFGTAPVFGGVPDQDYYRITLPTATHLVFSGTAEFRMAMAILDTQCPPGVIVRTIFPTHPCDDPQLNPMEADVPAGTYVLGVVNASPDSPCGDKNHYIVTISAASCVPSGRCCLGGSCQIMTQDACQAAGGGYAGDDTICPPPGGNYTPSSCNDAFEDISAVGSLGPVCDDCGAIVDIGFAFSFFGNTRTQVGVSSNGYFTFELNAFLGMSDNQPLPRSEAPEYVCPCWDDFRTDSGNGALYTATLGTAPHRRFIAMWKNVESFDAPGSSSTFEAILFEGSNTIAFRYAGLDPGDTPTAGVSNADGTVGVNLDPSTLGACTTLTLGPVPNPCGCPADVNHDSLVNSQDFFDFLSAFFVDAPSADFNHDHLINSQDFFDFLSAFFAGC